MKSMSEVTENEHLRCRFEELLVERGYSIWPEVYYERFRQFAFKKTLSKFSGKRLIGVMKILKQIQKLPRAILIIISDYATDMTGDRIECGTCKYNIVSLAIGTYGDLFIATERSILKWNCLTWKMKPIINKMKNTDVKTLCLGPLNNLLYILDKHDNIFALKVKKNKQYERVNFPFFKDVKPKVMRSVCDTKTSKLVVMSNFLLFLNTDGAWRKYNCENYIPNSVHFIGNNIYSLTPIQIWKAKIDDYQKSNNIGEMVNKEQNAPLSKSSRKEISIQVMH
eukprot:UN34070